MRLIRRLKYLEWYFLWENSHGRVQFTKCHDSYFLFQKAISKSHWVGEMYILCKMIKFYLEAMLFPCYETFLTNFDLWIYIYSGLVDCMTLTPTVIFTHRALYLSASSYTLDHHPTMHAQHYLPTPTTYILYLQAYFPAYLICKHTESEHWGSNTNRKNLIS